MRPPELGIIGVIIVFTQLRLHPKGELKVLAVYQIHSISRNRAITFHKVSIMEVIVLVKFAAGRSFVC